MKKLTRFNTIFIVALLTSLYLGIQTGQSQNKPYMEEEITFKNGDVTLGGTLTLPKTKGKHPAVVLISGSGAQNRDSDIVGFKVFKIIAEYLTSKGIAVLRYDDRGVGKSTGKTATSTSSDFADDVIEAVKVLEKRPDINPNQIGLLGHSEGGIVAPNAYVKYPKIAFIISMAGPALPGSDIILAQSKLMMEASKASKEIIDGQLKLSKMIFEAIKTDKGWDEVEKVGEQFMLKYIENLPDAQKAYISDPKAYAKMAIKQQLKPTKSPWYRFFVMHDPRKDLVKTKCPVLGVFGEKDLQVPAKMNEEALNKALATAGNKQVEVKIIKDANHLFQKSNTGAPTEYATLPKGFTADFLPTITDWLLKKVTIVK
ncbi:hypothetical protein BKI52_20060 [marine bacterium AO1-C]|nr:hypothetical protein BKI52_20060 [marine bacterium AO1-C]